MNQTFDNSTPVAMMTIGQLKEALRDEQPQPQPQQEERHYVYGIAGIRELFHVGSVTACKYKETIIKAAVTQYGRKIIVDADLAKKLFAEAGRKERCE